LAIEPGARAVYPPPPGAPWPEPGPAANQTCASRQQAKRTGRPSRFARPLSVVWALIPILTFGWGAPFTFTYAALRLRSKALGLCAGAYGVAAVVSFYLAGNDNDNSWQSNVGVALALLAGGVATAQAFAIRGHLVAGRGEPGANDSALGHATNQLRLREQARSIVATNPTLAHELQIGRPDRSRHFDDGGLVDVNHVPSAYLVQMAGIDAPTAERIAELRDGIGGFTSVDDLSVTLGLHPKCPRPGGQSAHLHPLRTVGPGKAIRVGS
jgi:DNA uptake protein ComE-like DNA-binding protein